MLVRLVEPEAAGREPPRRAEFEAPGRVRRWDGESIRYVEDKPVEAALVEGYLSASRRANQWSNFGPVSRQLEHELEDRLELRSGLRAVMCSSGTTALHAMICLHETLADRPLRWVTSAFGFYCAIQGPLASAAVVDSDGHAMLDLDLVDPGQIDGFVVTNTFGQQRSLDPYIEFAELHKKVMVVDSAMAFGSHPHGPNEIISFHHTKPWGFGEGGVAIVAEEDEGLFRSLIALGDVPGRPINRRASNYKASEIQCAYQLMRLAHMRTLAGRYREQYQRIVEVGLPLGLSVLADAFIHPSIPAAVPFQLPAPLADVRIAAIPTGKYYQPLADGPTAGSVYDRMVNVPCHPGMGAQKDRVIRDALEALLDRCH